MSQFVKYQNQPYEALTQFLSSRPLSGKSVLITGAGRGVGEHITKEIAAAGATTIAILGRDVKRIQSARDVCTKEYPETAFTAFAVDITDEAAVASVFKAFGTPDILINNAGVFPDEGPFVEQNLRTWFSGFETNVYGTAVVTQKYLQAKPPKDAVVLNVSSMAAHMRFPLKAWSGYNSSKAGQLRMFEYIRFEHPEVRFLNIHPGSIESDGYTKSGADSPPSGMTSGKLAGQFFAWAATEEAAFLSGRFLWAEWDIEELKGRERDILDGDLLLLTIDGFSKGF